MNEQTDSLEPYVGPRPFQREEGEFFFGRRLEVNDLVSLITAYQVVLLYAQSGAGKTSLLRASLIPQLEEEEKFQVLEPARVRRQGTSQVQGADIKNVFIFNALSSWKGDKISDVELAQMSLKDFLAPYFRAQGEENSSLMVIVFDQFEELFTHHLDRWEDREDFFRQVSEALEEDTRLRVYFVMREDYIAELDPYAHMLPGKLRTRFRMERLRRENALDAIKGPLEAPSVKDEGRRFADDVAEALVDDLLKVRVQTSSGEKEVPGQFVEPVQLQVVCQSLWHELKPEDKLITFEHLKAFGDVNEALTRFFDRTIEKATLASGVSEGALRRWFDRTLITPDGNRGTVRRGNDQTAGLSNVAIDVFESERLLRSEPRDGRLWYELSQDRLIKPIQNSYKQWLAKQPGDEQTRLRLEDQAEAWARKRDNTLLLDQGQLLIAKRWIEGEAVGGYSEPLYALVQASEAEIARAERERERELAQEQRLRAEAEAQRATALELRAQEQELRIEAERRAAVEQRRLAEEQQRLSQLQRERAEEMTRLAEERAAAQQREAEQSATLAEKERLRAEEKVLANRRLRYLAAGLAVMLLVSVGTAAYALTQRSRAKENENRAIESALQAKQQEQNAQTKAREAEVAKAQALKEADRASQAEREATHQKDEALAQKQKAEYAQRQERQAKLEAVQAKDKAQAAAQAEAGLKDAARQAEANAVAAKAEAEKARDISKSRELAADALAQLNNDPELGLLLAIKAADTKNPPKEARDALLKALEEAHLRSVIQRDDSVAMLTAVFNPDTKSVLTAAENGEVQKWNAPQERRPQQATSMMQSPDSKLTAVAFSRDRKVLATARGDETVLLWRLADKAPIALKSSGFDVRKIAVSPDSAYLLISGGNDVLMYDVGAQRPSAVLKPQDQSDSGRQDAGSNNKVNSLEFSADGTMAAVAQGNKVLLWDTGPEHRSLWKGPEVFEEKFPKVPLVGHVKQVNTARISADGKFVLTASDDRTARLWDIDGKLIYQFVGHEGEVTDANFSEDGNLIVTAGKDGTCRVWDTHTGLVVNVLRGHKGSVIGASFSRDGKYVVTIGEDKTTRVWQLNVQEPPRVLARHDQELSDVAISPDSKLIVTASYDKTAQVVNVATERKIVLQSEYPINRVAFSADGKHVFTVDSQGLRVWDASTGQLLFSLSGPGALSPDGRSFAAVTVESITVYETSTGRSIANLKAPDIYIGLFFANIALSPDNRLVAAANVFGDQLLVWNRETQAPPLFLKRQPSFPVSQDPSSVIASLTFSPDSKSLLVAYTSGSAEVWALTNLTPLGFANTHTLKAPTSLRGATYSPDGRYICTWGERTALIWDTASALTLSALTGHTDAIVSASFSPDSRLVVTASKDKTARVWDVASGEPLAELRSHSGLVSRAIFSPDSRRVVTSSYDSTARIFDCTACGSTKDILGSARTAAFRELTEPERQAYLSNSMTECANCSDLSHLLASACDRVTRMELTPAEKAKFSIGGSEEKPRVCRK